MKKTIIYLMLLSFFTTGCTGSFNLTKKVYNFHRSQPDKWADEICFLLVYLIPVYGFSMLADAIVFNSIEFWTGDNPVAYNNSGNTTKTVRAGKDAVEMTYDSTTDQISMTPVSDKTKMPKLVLERKDGQVIAKDEAGNILYKSVKDAQGNVSVFDKNDQLVKNYSSNDVESMKKQYLSK